MADASLPKLSSAHFYAWSQGLKTGQYYLRTRPSRDAIKFTLNVESLMKTADGSGLFDHMNTKNLTQAEMEKARRVKKRKLNSISNTDKSTENIDLKNGEFKQPAPTKKTI